MVKEWIRTALLVSAIILVFEVLHYYAGSTLLYYLSLGVMLIAIVLIRTVLAEARRSVLEMENNLRAVRDVTIRARRSLATVLEIFEEDGCNSAFPIHRQAHDMYEQAVNAEVELDRRISELESLRGKVRADRKHG